MIHCGKGCLRQLKEGGKPLRIMGVTMDDVPPLKRWLGAEFGGGYEGEAPIRATVRVYLP
jgi:hypothetical protein